MANRHNDPTDKFYIDATGIRPDVVVAFLGVDEKRDSAVNGVVFRAGGNELAQLDMRERRYRRVDATRVVSASVIDPGDRVYMYVPTREAKARCRRAAQDHRLVVPHHYFEAVTDAFRSLGPEQLARFAESTDTPPELSRLKRIDPGHSGMGPDSV